MSDTLKIFGQTFNNVAGIKAQDPEGNTITYEAGSGTTYTTLFDEDMVMRSGSPGWSVYEYYLVPFIANQTYRVTFNGVPYICETQADTGEMNTYDGYSIGNASYEGGTNTGEPFLIGRDAFSDPDPNHVQLVLESYATGTVHLKIELVQSSSGEKRWELMTQGVFSITADEGGGYFGTFLSPFDPIERGDKWRITWNGTTYVCEAQELISLGSEYATGYGIGNASAYGGTTGNNEPFFGGCFVFDGVTSLLFLTTASSGNVDIIAEKQVSSDSIWETVFSGRINVTSEEELDWYGAYNNWYEDILENSVYRVTWDGMPYICQATFTSDWFNNYGLGDPHIVGETTGGNNEPFFIVRMQSSVLVAFAATSQQPYVKIEKMVGSLIPKTITQNGTYNPADDGADGYSEVTVNVSAGTTWETVCNGQLVISGTDDGSYFYSTVQYDGAIELNSVWRITWNGIPYECTATSTGDPVGIPYAIGNDTIINEQGGDDEPFFIQKIYANNELYVFTSQSQTVNLIIEKQVSAGGSTLITKTITANGTYSAEDDDADGYSEVIVNVQGGSPSYTWETLLDSNVTINTSDPNYISVPNFATPLLADTTYRVTWGNSGSYVGQPWVPAGYTDDGLSLGNPSIADGGTDTGEPFVFYREYGNLYALTNDPIGAIHITIEKRTIKDGITLVPKTITTDGTYDPADDNADGYSEVTVNVSSYAWEKTYEGNIYLDSDWGNGYPYASFASYESIPLNSVWRITWDNVQYICTATWGSTDGDLYAIGNYLYEAGGSGGNNEPFFMQGYGGPSVWYVVGNQVGSHSVIVEKQVEAPPGLEYEEGTYTPAENVSKPTISFAKTHSTPPSIIIMSDATSTADSSPTYTQYSFLLCEWSSLFGEPIRSGSDLLYGTVQYGRRTTGSLAPSPTCSNLSYGFDDQTDSASTYPRYWVNESEFYPDDTNASTMWRSGRTYKWIAIWAPST